MPTKRTEPNRLPSAPPERIALQIGCTARGLPAARRLRALARAAAGRDAVITLRVVGGAEGRALNRRFRGRDSATNVLAFDYATDARRRPVRGDIVLCHPVVSREAREQKKPLAHHYAHLVVHGALHLRGYDHGRAKDTARMERRENRILRRFGVPDPYLVR